MNLIHKPLKRTFIFPKCSFYGQPLYYRPNVLALSFYADSVRIFFIWAGPYCNFFGDNSNGDFNMKSGVEPDSIEIAGYW